tara:strand:+ start:554 stop:670 length:117 start_codon:yes stop_codon:yes gene_type:complete
MPKTGNVIPDTFLGMPNEALAELKARLNNQIIINITTP